MSFAHDVWLARRRLRLDRHGRCLHDWTQVREESFVCDLCGMHAEPDERYHSQIVGLLDTLLIGEAGSERRIIIMRLPDGTISDVSAVMHYMPPRGDVS